MMILYQAAAPASRCVEPHSQSLDSPPPEFNADIYPILAQHWFGIEPFRPPSQIAAEKVADLRFRRQVQQLHDRGVRVVAELLAELGAERSITTIIDRKLDVYAELGLDALEAASGDRFWPVPLREV